MSAPRPLIAHRLHLEPTHDESPRCIDMRRSGPNATASVASGAAPDDLVHDALVELLGLRLDIDRCMITTTTGHGDPAPRHEVWRA